MPKTGTVAGDVRAMRGALKEIQPPSHVALRKQDKPFWAAILSARAADSWTDIDLAHAANLARTQADIERVQHELDAEGWTLENARGTVVQNPKFTILETLTRRAVLLSKSLQVHAHATVGESREQVAKSKKQRDMAAAKDDLDDLIAPPVH